MTPTLPRHIDVCNGDADGLCALLQWRLAHPLHAELVTGLKREHDLLARVQAQAGDEVMVVDLAFEPHRAGVQRLLDAGVRVRYVDHHVCAAPPEHPLLDAHLDADSQVCSGLLINRLLGGRFARWAVVCAHGDNLHAPAEALSRSLGLSAAHQQALRRLGEAINHNAYGDTLADVRVPPAALLTLLREHTDPISALAEPRVQGLLQGMDEDLARARQVRPEREAAHAAIWCLPNADWARRASGSLANSLASERPDQACAVLRPLASGHWLISVRAPRHSPFGAAALCQRFGGGGRQAAGGIDALPPDRRSAFVEAFWSHRWSHDGPHIEVEQPPQRHP